MAGRLETRTSRLRLPIAKKPVWVASGLGIGLGYRRNVEAGTWVVRVADGLGGYWTRRIGLADDVKAADGVSVLTFWQAQDKARAVAGARRQDRKRRREERTADRPPTITEALGRYSADLDIRGGDTGNVGRVKAHLPPALGNKLVTLVTTDELKKWRNGLAQLLAPATVNRIANALRAALNLAAENDPRITNRDAWKNGLKAIPDAERSRNVIIAEDEVLAIIQAAYADEYDGEAFGLLTETAAVTGARYSQICRLEVHDLQDDRADPRLMMPSSRKGRGKKEMTRRPIPIPSSLAAKLRAGAAGRASATSLLVRVNGAPWRKSDQSRPFRRAVENAGLDPKTVTIYALRHTNIVRQLLANVPVRIVAVSHDTSVAMIEKNYSRHIGDHTDAIVRKALLDPAAPSSVVQFVKRA